MGFTVGGAQNGFTINASASQSRGQADGSDLRYTNTHVSANQVLIASGGDTTLKGAAIQGQQVKADIGGDLKIESLQDKSTYNALQQSAGAGVSLCIPPICYGASSGSASFSNNKAQGDFLSVAEQSGIQAGDLGFQLNVKGNTNLKGGVIASSQAAIDQGRNSLTTGTLTNSELQNHDQSTATGIALSGSYSTSLGDQTSDAARQNMSDKDKLAANSAAKHSGANAASPGFDQSSTQQRSVTTSGVSGGSIVVTNVEEQKALTGKDASVALASLNRNVTTDASAAGALKKAWDGEQLMQQTMANVQIAASFGTAAHQKLSNYVDTQRSALKDARQRALKQRRCLKPERWRHLRPAERSGHMRQA